MPIANICFNPDWDACAIEFGGHPRDMPLNAVNEGLGVLQERFSRDPQDFFKLFIYEVYNGRDLLGMLIAGNFNPESDAEIRALWDGIIDQNRNAALTGDLEPIQVQI